VRARVLAPEAAPPALAMCAGYDEQRWRAKALVEHLCQWIPEWALRYGELNERLDSATLMAMSRRAALKVYTSKNFEGRGEFGEIMLHAVIRHEFDTHPAISKIFFKDRANDYVKGFDLAQWVADDCVVLERELRGKMHTAGHQRDAGSHLRDIAHSKERSGEG